MPINPNEDKLTRYGKIVAGIIGAVASFGLDVLILVTGRTSGLSGLSQLYTPAKNPSQFWFTGFLFALFGIASSWYAWYWYRE